MGKIGRRAIAVLLLAVTFISMIPETLLVFVEADGRDIGESVAVVGEEGYIENCLQLTFDGEVTDTVELIEGSKDYLYTKFAGELSENVRYTWQILINEEKNRWATINDYVLNYAIISEALIENNPNTSGHATIRCIATDGDDKYVSQSVSITKVSLPEQNIGFFDLRAESDGDESLVASNSDDAFQIVINYEFRHADAPTINGKTASSPFVITLPSATSYTGTIAAPPVLGYSPYILDENGTFEYDGQKYSFAHYHSFEQQKDAVTVNVYYIPNVVNYTVKYYEQNPYNDEYTYVGSSVKTGYSDTVVGEGLDVARDGFKALAYDKESVISGDGNSVVEIYYDRLYCLVDIELGDGGHGVVPYYVRHDTQIVLGTPTRAGYSFRGWSLTTLNDKTYDQLNDAEKQAWAEYSVATVGGTMLTLSNAAATKMLYTAIWEKARTTYSAIYWVENADDDGFTLWGYRTYDATPGDIVSAKDDIDRPDKNCFIYNDARSDHNVVVDGDGTTAVNVYYNRKYYSLVFVAPGVCTYQHTHGDGNCHTPMICGNENTHVHTAECGTPSVVCGYDQHTHSDACKNTCNIPNHPAHTADCLICTVPNHTHNYTCYDGASNSNPGRYVSVSGQQQNGYIGRSGNSWFGGYKYWIYVEGAWYSYNGSTAYGNKAPTNSSCPGEHTHSEENGCYSDAVHVHIEQCCNIPEHTHDSTYCYEYPCGQRQHSHDACYGECTLYEHTHTGNCSRSGSGNIVKVLNKKYDAYIADVWPIVDDNGVEYLDSGWWKSSASNNYYTLLHKMPDQDLTLTFETRSGNTYSWDYAFEKLPGADYGSKPTVTSGDKEYFIDFSSSVKATSSVNLTYDEDYFDITGFTQRDSTVPNFSNRHAYLYYTRNSYMLSFNDGERIIKEYECLYQQDISNTYDFEFGIPVSKEQGSVYFAGWYTTPTCSDGTEFTFTGATMPAGDLILYAKWLPMQYNVKVYHDDTLSKLLLDETVYFDEMVLEPANVSAGALIFAGWYYMDGATEKRFDFNTMMVKKDYVIYAKWTSVVPVDYVIYYRVKHADGREEDIAEPERGEALVGMTKTFVAKSGAKLYEDYRVGYFPEARSISVEMSADATQNEYVFIYEHKETVHYSVTHVFTDNSNEATTGTTLYSLLGVNWFSMSFNYEISNASDTAIDIVISFRERVTESNIKNAIRATNPNITDADVAAAWNIVKNLSPDMYEKEIILESDHSDGSNDIRFEWSYKETSCVYQIVHYTQDVDAVDGGDIYEDYTMYNASSFMVDYVAGKNVSAEYHDIPGFHINPELSGCKKDENGELVKINGRYVCEGTLTRPTVGDMSGGLIIRIYYDRNMINYKVRHVTAEREIVIERGPVRYGTTVVEVAEDVILPEDKELMAKYYVQGSIQRHVEIVSDGQEIIFAYRLHVVSYYYVVAGQGYRGTLSNYNEEVDVNATPKGSSPTPAEGYLFAGWFMDAECTVPVPVTEATIGSLNNTIIPIPSAEDVGVPQYYYAKFVPTTIVIRNTGVEDTSRGFIYRLQGVAGTPTENVDLVFTIVGNGSVSISNLAIGEYTLYTNGNWSYRYGDAVQHFIFDENKTVWVTYGESGQKWLGDCAYAKIK